MGEIKTRALTMEDLKVWGIFAHNYSDTTIRRLVSNTTIFYEGFDTYMEAKINKNEAYMAVDGPSKECVGIISFSRNHNRITFFGVSEQVDFEYVGSKLIEICFEKLNCTKPISVNVLDGEFEPLLKEKKLFEKYGFSEYDNTICEAGVPATMMRYTPNKCEI